jgi:hypothetical protein
MKHNLRHFKKLPAELFSALGAVAVRSGQIEHILAVTIRRTRQITLKEAYQRVDELWHSDKIRKETKRSFRSWAIEKFGTEKGNERSRMFDQLVNAWANSSSDRNDFLHGFWSGDIGDGHLNCNRKGVPLKRKDGTLCGIRDVEILAERLTDLALQLNDATARHQNPPIMETAATAVTMTDAELYRVVEPESDD